MTTNVHRLDNVVTRCSSPTNSGPSNLTPNGLTEGTLPGEHTTHVSEGYGGEDQRTILTGSNGITEGMLKESGERGERQVEVTIDILPDDALLEIFSFYVVGKVNTSEWRTLAHVCQRWRGIVLASPRRLDVRLVCTARTRVEDILAAWSGLPLLALRDSGPELSRWEGADNIIAALRHKTRVSQIELSGHSSHLLRRVAEAIQESFPVLSHLGIRSLDDAETAVAFPDEILGGSAPSLRSCSLRSIAFPGIWKLLLTADRLVDLCLERIPSCTHISSEGMAHFLSALSHLEMLTIQFQCPRPRESIRSLPPETRFVLPSLTDVSIHGDCEYVEDLCSRIDAPLLELFRFTFFTVGYHTSRWELQRFLDRTERSMQRDQILAEYL